MEDEVTSIFQLFTLLTLAGVSNLQDKIKLHLTGTRREFFDVGYKNDLWRMHCVVCDLKNPQFPGFKILLLILEKKIKINIQVGYFSPFLSTCWIQVLSEDLFFYCDKLWVLYITPPPPPHSLYITLPPFFKLLFLKYES